MYWIADVLLIVFIILMATYGIKRGLFGTVGEIVGVILALALGLAGAAGLVLYPFGGSVYVSEFVPAIKPYVGLGWVKTIGDSLFGQIGGDSAILRIVSGATGLNLSAEQVGYFLAMLVLLIISFIFCYILFMGLMRLLRKGLLALRKFVVYRVIDSIVGCVATLAVAAAVVAVIIGGVMLLPKVFPVLNETFRASELCGIIYDLLGKLLVQFGLL